MPRSDPGPPSALGKNVLLLNQRGIGDVLLGGGGVDFLFLFFPREERLTLGEQ